MSVAVHAVNTVMMVMTELEESRKIRTQTDATSREPGPLRGAALALAFATRPALGVDLT
jgi:hypothetical protein